ncbi:MAG TPA: iron-containing alcohol dehydrogenase [Blastocatellia bacterium]|nr:iron-containing alcohol dehydrogenase [Blastocatellia bacterium]
MQISNSQMGPFDFQLRTRIIFGEGTVERLGDVARELGLRRTLLVADHGLLASGHVEEAILPLKRAGITAIPFHDFDINPDTKMIEAGRDFAAHHEIDSVIGLGGGSSMDCAKGINFLLTNGGRMQDYWGFGKAAHPMLPMIAVPTTAGTGSEAQSYALISDAETHVKMACGDPKAAFRVAILDPRLTVSQPAAVTASAGFDAIAHAVETYVTTKRNPLSQLFSREAWRLLEANFERVLSSPADIEARGAMQLGAYYAGMAIENSMLGATHACANPLTTHFDTTHGVAIAMLLPSVVRWNASVAGPLYAELLKVSGITRDGEPGEALSRRLEQMAAAGGLAGSLSGAGVGRNNLQMLAEEAASQWTGRFNPRPFDAAGALEVYECAF